MVASILRQGIDRRTLLIGGGVGAGLIVAVALWPRHYAPNLAAATGETIYGAWLKLGDDGQVTVAVPQAEHGQGVYTTLPQIVADEDDLNYEPKLDHHWVYLAGIVGSADAKPPPDAKAEEIYLYRPDIFQDQDGIERRITLFLDPKARVKLKDLLGSTPLNATARPSGPAVPATAAAPANDPFQNPAKQSSKPAAGTNAAPTGVKN